ncbi:MAG TPA: membrane dipeptidase [Solirubrobacterales bacterium]|nr:membrane dipeptidase [Solirubrobacterales bacterium]
MTTTPACRELFESAIVIDGLDTSQWGSEATYRKLREGGVTAINATLSVWDGFDALISNLGDWHGWFERFGDLIRPVRSLADVKAAKEERRTGIIFGLQNPAPIADDLRRVRLLQELGIRIVQLTYNERNLIGDGCYEPTDVGLSRFGLDVVGEMNEHRVLIDLSHCGERTTREAIEASEQPVAVTHAGPKARFRHPRNKEDETIRLLAEHGGVIGANAYPLFLPNGYDTTLREFVDGVEYLVELAGIDHVGIGTDFCEGRPPEWFRWVFATSHGHRMPEHLPTLPDPHRQLIGFEDQTHFIDLAEMLLDRGYAEEDVLKLLGGNWMRLLAAVCL